MVEEEIVSEVEDTQIIDEKPLDLSEEEIPEEPKTEPETISISKEELERLKKREQDAENYKRENEIYRRQKREKEIKPEPASNVFEDDQTILVQNDFLSKKEDVLHEIKGDIMGLSDEEWQKAKPLLNTAINSVYEKAVVEKRFAAKGEIESAVKDLLEYAKGFPSRKADVEKARLKGMVDLEKINRAEIKGASTTVRPKPSKVVITEEDKKKAADSEGFLTPERAAEIRIRRTKVSENWENLYKE